MAWVPDPLTWPRGLYIIRIRDEKVIQIGIKAMATNWVAFFISEVNFPKG